jgi:catechol 2,3-dioxygenase-like lactoylglutathione lyase family enzyme
VTRVAALDHVQLAMPAGGEGVADGFYCGLLGLRVLDKPAPLAQRGGRWYASGVVQVHLGVDPEFRPARRAHPALRIGDYDALVTELAASPWVWRHDDELPGVRRLYVDDPFGNRIELIDAQL